MATILRETTPEHQTRLMQHIVERVTVTAGSVSEITVRMEARPFFADMAMAPPESLGGSGPHAGFVGLVRPLVCARGY